MRKTLLLVDDEPCVISSLRRALAFLHQTVG